MIGQFMSSSFHVFSPRLVDTLVQIRCIVPLYAKSLGHVRQKHEYFDWLKIVNYFILPYRSVVSYQIWIRDYTAFKEIEMTLNRDWRYLRFFSLYRSVKPKPGTQQVKEKISLKSSFVRYLLSIIKLQLKDLFENLLMIEDYKAFRKKQKCKGDWRLIRYFLVWLIINFNQLVKKQTTVRSSFAR